jgi:hypothetical protein
MTRLFCQLEVKNTSKKVGKNDFIVHNDYSEEERDHGKSYEVLWYASPRPQGAGIPSFSLLQI